MCMPENLSLFPEGPEVLVPWRFRWQRALACTFTPMAAVIMKSASEKWGAERFIDYRKENYADVLSDVDHVLDTLGDRELPNEFRVLKEGGNLVSLRGLPNGRFARRNGMPLFKRLLFQLAGSQYDRMAAAKKQTYDFLFVHEDGSQLDRIGRLFDKEHSLETSIDTVYDLEEINKALTKVKQGKSKGKTIITVGEQ